MNNETVTTCESMKGKCIDEVKVDMDELVLGEATEIELRFTDGSFMRFSANTKYGG